MVILLVALQAHTTQFYFSSDDDCEHHDDRSVTPIEYRGKCSLIVVIQRDISTHMDEKPFPCDQCTKTLAKVAT